MLLIRIPVGLPFKTTSGHITKEWDLLKETTCTRNTIVTRDMLGYAPCLAEIVHDGAMWDLRRDHSVKEVRPILSRRVSEANLWQFMQLFT